ncbi:MAG: aspartate aminotransferase family protein [Planctomycetes bacterium]|nr:aspartate aminotransferase family protein [Planctomycetota bacterium]
MTEESQPGHATRETLERYQQYVIGNYTRLPLVAVRGEGPYLWDADGKRYIDLFSGWAVTGLGHCHPRLVAAIREQAGKLIYMPNTWYTEPQGRLAEWIATTGFGGKTFFCNSGAEANEAAIKLARIHTAKGKYKFITFENSFHGRTFAAITATAQPKYHQGFQPLVPGFSYAPLNDLDAVEKLVDEETCAILVEVVQGEGGVNIADPEWLRALRDLCDQRGMMLIFDEVQTGVGRCGTWWGWQTAGVTPDIMTMAKQLGGGTAIGAMCARPEVAASLVPGTHASTFGGNPLAAAAGCAVFETIRDENLLENVAQMGAHARQRFLELKQETPFIAEVRAVGLMIGVELAQNGASLVADCLRRGLHVNCTHNTVLRIMPPLNITREQLDEGIDILADALRAWHPTSA